MDRLEQDALKVLRLVRSVKNSFAPISRIPPELLFLVTRYLDNDRTDKALIALTHVCRGWREVLTTFSSLWTRLDCANVEKTRVYLKRSKYSPLEVILRKYGVSRYRTDAFQLVIPHISRAGSLTLTGGGSLFQILTTHFSCPIPLLRNLDIDLVLATFPVLNCTLFNGDLSSLCKLRLSGVDPHLPWKNMSKLTSFALQRVPGNKISVTQLLDLFENATFLSEIKLGSAPNSSDAPPERVVPLPHLKSLTILTDLQRSSTLLNHLSIPPGAFLLLGFDLPGDESLLRTLLPKTSDNLQNISCITSVYLDFVDENFVIRLNGPSGKLRLCGYRDLWTGTTPMIPDRVLLQSLDNFALSKTQELGIAMYESVALRRGDTFAPHHILGAMGDLRTLSLNRCNNLPFILTLDPDQSPSKAVLCPKLESLVLYVKEQWLFHLSELVTMAKARTLEGVKLQSIMLISRDELALEREVSELREYVTRVEYNFGVIPPKWDTISDYEGE